jgi:hypothetical protein
MASCRSKCRVRKKGGYHATSRSSPSSRRDGHGSRSVVPFIYFMCLLTGYALGAKVVGHRGYFYTNDGVDLNQALISYGLDFLRKRGFKKVQPPFMMNKDIMAKTAQLDQFDEELYKVYFLPIMSPSSPLLTSLPGNRQ